MNRYIVRLLPFVSALMLAAFALPSIAGSTTKSFFAQFPAVGDTTLSMLIQNTSTGGGTSTINSMSVKALSGTQITGLVMTAPTQMQPTLTYPNLPDMSYVVVTNFPGITKQSSATFQLTLNTLACPQGFQVAANAGNSVQLNGDAFIDTNGANYTYTVACSEADLICPSAASSYPNATQINQDINSDLTRFENKDGSACVPIASSLTFDSAARKVTALWDGSAQPSAVLQSHTTWAPELTGAQGSPNPTLYSTDGVNTYIAPMCLTSLVPSSFGVLTAGIDNAVTSFTITPSPADVSLGGAALPFPIVIASSTSGTLPERMLVTGRTSNGDGTYTVNVTRHTGGTPASAHALGAKVMSIASPISTDSTNGPVGVPVKACIWKENVIARNVPEASDCPMQTGPEPLKACIQVESWLYLFGDILITR